MSADSWPDLAAVVVESCHDAFGQTALYQPVGGGPAQDVSLVLHPALDDIDLPGGYGRGRFAARGRRVELLARQVPAPTAGDELHLPDGLRLRLQGEPRLEAEATLWLCDAYEVDEE